MRGLAKITLANPFAIRQLSAMAGPAGRRTLDRERECRNVVAALFLAAALADAMLHIAHQAFGSDTYRDSQVNRPRSTCIKKQKGPERTLGANIKCSTEA